MSDLLSPLLTTIETVRDRIKLARSGQGWNEAQTRASLIDPILTVLGWDTEDPALVLHEYRTPDGQADYALLHSEGKLAAIIEAKALDHKLDIKEINQTTHYANNRGAKFAVLSDGDHWILFDVFKPVVIEEKQLMDIVLSRDEPQASALSLLALWRPNARSGAWRKAEKPRVEPNSIQPPPPPPKSNWVPFDSLTATGEPPPALMRFEDGHEWRPQYWWSVLQGTIDWLYRRKSLTEAHMPFMNKVGKRPLIHLQTAAATLLKPKPVPGTPLMFQGHMSAATVFRVTKRLLTTCGHTPSKVLVRPGK
ncbi:MAG: type I restriction enzyme HsdR N-terminal domain-containing protein [Acidobacteria bacterium]|nr:type I restriction enzyme HsdR N-terminal domain-containing protein [Acidobacteriota bacterium]